MSSVIFVEVLCLVTVLVSVQWSLAFSFGFWSLFFFVKDVLPYVVYAVIIKEAIALEMSNSLALLWLWMFLLNEQKQFLVPFESLTGHPFFGPLVLTTTEHNV